MAPAFLAARRQPLQIHIGQSLLTNPVFLFFNPMQTETMKNTQSTFVPVDNM